MDRAKPTRFRDERGFTLIELIIVSALMVAILAIVVPSVDSITGANLKASASSLAGAIRFTYDLAARKNAVFRVVIDLDENTYWVETTQGKFLLDREKTEVRDGLAEETEEDAPRRRRFVSRSYIEGGDMWEPKKRPSFSDFAGPLTPKVKLPDDITFQDVWVAHQSDLVSAGQAYLYCFPTGMTERAVIHIVEDDEDFYSLQVEALTGTVKIFPHYLEVPRE